MSFQTAISLAAYWPVVFLCGWVVLKYGKNLRATYAARDAVWWMRLGINIGFALGGGLHALLWGVQRYLVLFGLDSAAAALRGELLEYSMVFRVALAISAMLHLHASWVTHGQPRRWLGVTATVIGFWLALATVLATIGA